MTSTTIRRALLVSTDDEPMNDIESDLQAAGYEVLRCHPSHASGFPCGVLTEAGCPLDGVPVDVTVDVRQHPWPHPTLREQGVTCSVRAGVPVVVLGRELHPFVPWATITTQSREHLTARCDDAIRESLVPLHDAAAHAVRQVLARLADGQPFVVEVDRREGDLRVRIIAELASVVAGMAATRAVAAIRALDAHAGHIDVEVVAPT